MCSEIRALIVHRPVIRGDSSTGRPTALGRGALEPQARTHASPPVMAHVRARAPRSPRSPHPRRRGGARTAGPSTPAPAQPTRLRGAARVLASDSRAAGVGGGRASARRRRPCPRGNRVRPVSRPVTRPATVRRLGTERPLATGAGCGGVHPGGSRCRSAGAGPARRVAAHRAHRPCPGWRASFPRSPRSHPGDVAPDVVVGARVLQRSVTRATLVLTTTPDPPEREDHVPPLRGGRPGSRPP